MAESEEEEEEPLKNLNLISGLFPSKLQSEIPPDPFPYLPPFRTKSLKKEDSAADGRRRKGDFEQETKAKFHTP